MQRWNGWGDDSIDYPLPESARRYLESLVGPGNPAQEPEQPHVLQQVPATRLPEHRLVDPTPLARLLHARGQSLPDWVALRSGRITAFPDGVAYPTTSQEVSEVLQFAAQTGAHLIPYGGGTSVVGHINPLGQAAPTLTVDMRRMNRLLNFEANNLLATFGAGVTGPDLEAQLRAKGCTLGHFPQSFEYSTLGGWVASRSSGQQSLGYGRIERLFAGAQLETPQGLLEMPVFPASAAGPDLREVVLGSEGRLGILTQVTVRVSPLPEREDFHAIFFPDFEHGMAAARRMLAERLPLCMLRLSTAVETSTTLALAGHEKVIGALQALLRARGLRQQKCMLLVGFCGKAGAVQSARSQALAAAAAHAGVHVGKVFGAQWHKNRFRTPYLRNTLWQLGYAIDTLETAANWERVPALVDAIENALRNSQEGRIHVFTHLSHLYLHGSSIYTTYLFPLSTDPEQTLARWQAMKAAASQTIVEHGGTISHQHGVGTDHAAYLPAEKGALGMQVIQQIASSLDPQGLMNPGKLF